MRTATTIRLAVLAVLALAVGACGTDADPEPTIDPIAGPDDGAEEIGEDDGVSELPTGEGAATDLDALTAAAVADLAATEGIAESDVEVVTAERVTWSDGALGCPEPGMMYTQALVPGYRIVLATAGGEVAYHGAEGQPPARCDDPQPPSDSGD
ncbi:MAG: hypothetical protein WEB03_16865 [Nitriliruptor sp.]|uniref:hypothetical protein n=1 Tax=Nitriliruptor sp. TaxID=2448056 RepID=UPI0034A0099A